MEETVTTAGETTVTGAEEIDLTNAPALKAEMETAGKGCERLTLDLTATGFIDSAGLEALVVAYKRQRVLGYRLRVLLRAGSQPAKIISLSRLDTVLAVTKV